MEEELGICTGLRVFERVPTIKGVAINNNIWWNLSQKMDFGLKIHLPKSQGD